MKKILCCLALLLSMWGICGIADVGNTATSAYASNVIGSSLNGNTDYRCVWPGGNVSQFVDLSSAVYNEDGITAIIVMVNNRNDNIIDSDTYTFSCDGRNVYYENIYTGNSGKTELSRKDAMCNAYLMLTGSY